MKKGLAANQNLLKEDFNSAESAPKILLKWLKKKITFKKKRPWKFEQIHNRLLDLWRQEGENFFLLQIGANDGVTNDPICRFVRDHRPAGLLVEPLPDVFEKLQKTYPKSDYPNLDYFNGAIHEREKEVVIFRIARSFEATYRELYKRHTNPSGISSLNKDHVKNFLLRVAPEYFQKHDVEGVIERSRVPACTVKELLERHGINRISFAQVDAEGYDGTIVNMLLDALSDKLPPCINFESRSLSDKERNELFERLHTLGYRLFHEGSDTSAVLGHTGRAAAKA